MDRVEQKSLLLRLFQIEAKPNQTGYCDLDKKYVEKVFQALNYHLWSIWNSLYLGFKLFL